MSDVERYRQLLRSDRQALNATQVSPKASPESIQTGAELKVSPLLVESQPDAFRKPPDYAQILRKAPKTAQFAISNPIDDLEDLSYVERVWRDTKQGMERGNLTMELKDIAQDAIAQGGYLTPEQADRERQIKERLAGMKDMDLDFVSGIPGATAEQVPLQIEMLGRRAQAAGVGALGGAALGSIVPGAGTAVGARTGARAGWVWGAAIASAEIEGSLAYLDYMDITDEDGAPLSHETRLGAAMVAGTINGLLEMVGVEELYNRLPGIRNYTRHGLKRLLKNPTTRGAFLRYARTIGETMAIEGSTEVVQGLVTKMVGMLADPTIENADQLAEKLFTRENFLQAVEEFTAGAQGGGGMAAILTAPNLVSDLRDVKRAKQAEAGFLELGERVKASKTASGAEAAVDAVIDENDVVYMDVQSWDRYWQSQNADPREVAQEVLGDATEYDRASSSGHAMPIPVRRYASRLAPTQHNAELSRDLRMDPDAMTSREAEEFLQAQLDLGQGDPVFDAVTQMLTEQGFDQQTAETNAAQMSAFFNSVAKRVGQDPMRLFEKYGLNVSREDLTPEGAINQQQVGVQPDVTPASAQMVMGDPEIQQAAAQATAMRPTVDDTSPERAQMRAQVAQQLRDQYGYGDAESAPQRVPAERKALIIIGPPGAGKSFMQREIAPDWALLDSDEAKPLFPEYQGGVGANAVHMESKLIAAALRKDFVERGLNVVEPVIGQDAAKVRDKIQKYKDAGYDVQVSLVHVSPQKSMERAVERYRRTGRYVPPEYIEGVGTRPLEVFQELVKEGLADAELAYTTERDTPERLDLGQRSGRPDAGRAGDGRSDTAGRSDEKRPGVGAGQFANVRYFQEADVRRLIYGTDPLKADGLTYIGATSDERNFVSWDEALIEIQRVEQEERGYLDIGPNRQLSIGLLKDADLSTFLHESGHAYLEVMRDLDRDLRGRSDLTADQEGFLEDMDTLLGWMGLASFDEIGVDQHEQFARGFEAYLMEGKAPSVELRTAFARFRSWLLAIYRQLKNLNVSLNDNVREVFDRMLATDEQIEAAQNEAVVFPVFTDAQSAGMTDAEFKDYQKTVEQASLTAREDLEQQLMKQWRREAEKWWRQETKAMQAEVEDEFSQRRGYSAWERMRTSKGENKIKLDLAELKETYSPEQVDRFKAMRITAARGGSSVSDVAELFGYANETEFVDEMLSLPPIKDAAAKEARKRMLAKHGDLLNDGRMADEAKQAVMGDKRAEVIQAEIKALRALQRKVEPMLRTQRQTAQERQRATIDQLRDLPSLQQVRARARGMVSLMRVRDIRPSVYMTAVRKNSAAALEAAARNDHALAAFHKQQELLNLELYKEATRVKEEVEKIRRYVKQFGEKKYQERLGKAGQAYRQQINKILERYSFAKVPLRSLDREQSLQAFIDAERAEGRDPAVPQEVLDRIDGGRGTVNFRNVTIEELRGVHDSVKSIYHLARFKNKMLDERLKKDREAIAAEVAEQIAENAPQGVKSLPKGWRRNIRTFGKQYLTSLLNAETLLRALGGFVEDSPVYRYIKGNIDRATSERLIPMQESSSEKITEIYSVYSRKELREMGKERYNEELGRHISKEEMLVVALNWGNEGNREALLQATKEGRAQYTQQDVAIILRQLDKRDWDFVQSVWDYINDGWWPQLKEFYEKRKGVAPAKVEATPVETPFGTYKGGYYPLKYDPEFSFRVTEEDAAEVAKGVMTGRFAWAQTSQGFAKERVGSGGRPVRTDLSVWHQHVNNVIQVLALSDAINDSQAVLASKPVREAMEASGNVEALTALDNWLKDTASGEIVSGDWLSRLSRRIRIGFTISKLGWNVGTIMIQPLGLTQSAVVLGHENLFRSVWEVIRHPKEVAEQVDAASSFMRSRKVTFNKDMMDTMSALKNSRLPGWLVSSMFGGIVFTQRFVDLSTWIAAHKQGQDKGVSDPVQYADRVVARGQASGIWGDRTPIERGTLAERWRQNEMVRGYTALGSYMFAKANVAYEVTRKTSFKDPVQIAKWIVDMSMLYVFEAVLLAIMRGMWDEDDEPEDVALKMSKEVGLGVMGSLPVIREFGSEWQGFRGGGVWGSFLGETSQAMQQLGQGEIDASMLKALNDVGGVMFKYPSSQMNRTLNAFYEDMQGEDVAPIDYLIWREKD